MSIGVDLQGTEVVDPIIRNYTWHDWMRPILHGIPIEQERACQQMVRYGLEYLQSHPDCKPKFTWAYTVFCALFCKTDDARDLWWHMRDRITEGGRKANWTLDTRAASLRTVLYIACHGWETYVQAKCKHPGTVDGVCVMCKKDLECLEN